jgi:hypothetical protein
MKVERHIDLLHLCPSKAGTAADQLVNGSKRLNRPGRSERIRWANAPQKPSSLFFDAADQLLGGRLRILPRQRCKAFQMLGIPYDVLSQIIVGVARRGARLLSVGKRLNDREPPNESNTDFEPSAVHFRDDVRCTRSRILRRNSVLAGF